jgi:hypothetical protein
MDRSAQILEPVQFSVKLGVGPNQTIDYLILDGNIAFDSGDFVPGAYISATTTLSGNSLRTGYALIHSERYNSLASHITPSKLGLIYSDPSELVSIQPKTDELDLLPASGLGSISIVDGTEVIFVLLGPNAWPLELKPPESDTSGFGFTISRQGGILTKLDDNETEEDGTVGITWGDDSGWDTVINQAMTVTVEPPPDPIPLGVPNRLVFVGRPITDAFEPMAPTSATPRPTPLSTVTPTAIFTPGGIWSRRVRGRILSIGCMTFLSMSLYVLN